MKGFSSLTPQNFYLFLLEDKLLLYRFGNAFLNQDKFKEMREYSLSGDRSLTAALRQVRQDFMGKADDSWFLGLPLRHFTLITFTLPSAASENLDQAVHYALMRHVPYDLSMALVHYESTQQDDQITVVATIAQKGRIRPYLEAVASAGVTLTAVFPSLIFWSALNQEDGLYLTGGSEATEIVVWTDQKAVFHAFDSGSTGEQKRAFFDRTRSLVNNLALPPERMFLWENTRPAEELAALMDMQDKPVALIKELPTGSSRDFLQQPNQINLVPASVLKQRKLAFWFQVAAVLLLLVSFAAFPVAQLLGKKSRLKTIEHKITTVEAQAEELSDIRKQNSDIIGLLEIAAAQVQRQPVPSELLKELTEILSPNTWLESFILSKGKIQIQGTTDSATSVIEALENSPLFEEAHFDSPITKNGNQEIFKIVASLED